MKNVAIKGKYIPKNKDKFLSKRTPIYRSMWERRFMIYCDKSENILEWDSESIHIPYISPKDDRWHNYYPDFYIKYKDKNDHIINAIIEIKPKYQMKWDVNFAKWKACQKICMDAASIAKKGDITIEADNLPNSSVLDMLHFMGANINEINIREDDSGDTIFDIRVRYSNDEKFMQFKVLTEDELFE